MAWPVPVADSVAGARPRVPPSDDGAGIGGSGGARPQAVHHQRRTRALGLPATILRPVRFMENRSHPTVGVREGVPTDVVKPHVPVQLIAATDIGAFATLAFTDPDRYIGRALEIAGDELTLPRVADAISRATRVPVTYRAIPREALTGPDPEARAGYDFANHRGGRRADIPELRRLHPALMDFDTWLRDEGAERFDALFHRQGA